MSNQTEYGVMHHPAAGWCVYKSAFDAPRGFTWDEESRAWTKSSATYYETRDQAERVLDEVRDLPSKPPVLKSERGIELVYQGRQGSTVLSVLTLESYIKWYCIYAVSPDWKVSKLPDGLSSRYEKETGDFAWSDHLPNVRYCQWLADTLPDQYVWDEPSLDMIAGRWWRERQVVPLTYE